MVPYHVAFEEATGGLFIFETVVKLVFMTDVCLSFNTAIVEHEHWIVWRPRIAQIYLSFWFWIDATSSIPFELIELYAASKRNPLEQFAPLVRVLRLFRMMRLLPVCSRCCASVSCS
jgi:hyperpolarization activated cyclic nucleotide-gated potassium channel 2